MKTISVSQLKARLSENLRLVEGGETVVVLDHKRAVAKLEPMDTESMTVTIARRAVRPFDFLEHDPIGDIDPLLYLEAERADPESP